MILIVDDERPVRQLIAAILAQEGYETLQARDGCEALELAQKHRIDLLLTDIDMPGINGTELVRLMKERRLVERSLLVTGYGAHAAGSVPLLAKPFTPQQLLGNIQAVLAS